MEKYKKLYEKFVVSTGDVLIYEERESSIGTARGFKHVKVQPIFQSDFWEIYALHGRKGISYAIIGLHKKKRVFYAKDVIFSTTALYFKELGCDLAYTLVTEENWKILSVGNKETLRDITLSIMNKKDIKDVSFADAVLQVTFSGGITNQVKFFVQKEAGVYSKIPKEEVFLVRAQFRAANKKQINHRTF